MTSYEKGGSDPEMAKTTYNVEDHDIHPSKDVLAGTTTDLPGQQLERGLQSRQVSMIAIGGALGTGLIIGTGKALAQSGPASVLIAYSFVGFLVWLVMTAVGEMAAWIPVAGGFSPFATRFVDPALGFALGYTYWFKYIIVTPNQLVAAALVISYWVPAEKVNPGVWITIFLVVIIAINFCGIRFFGAFEFWLSSIKVLVVCGMIILSLVLALGGGPNHDRTGFRYWQNPGAFKEYIDKGSAGKFIGLWASMVTAIFAFLGTELVGVTVGEAENPRKTIPRAIKLTFFRILIFYVLSVFLLGMIVPYNSRELAFANKASSSSAASPFVVAIKLAGIKGLPGFLNACILLFVFSACNSDLYIASRTIHGLALKGQAPAFLAKTDKRGVPYNSLALSSCFCLLAYMNVASDSKLIFTYLVNLVTIFGLLTWISILVTHIYFRRACKAQGVSSRSLPYSSPLGIWGSYFSLFWCVIIALTKNFPVFTGDTFDYKTFITGYLGIPLYLMLIFGWKFAKKTKGIRPEDADLWTGKDVFDRDEEYWKAVDAEKDRTKDGSWFYRTFLSWLF